MTRGQRIKKVRTDAQLNQVDLARMINVSKQTLYKYENDIITNIPSDKIYEIASICKVQPSYLMGWNDNTDLFDKFPNLRPIDRQQLPMLGGVACGEPIFSREPFEFDVEAGEQIDADYCLRAIGDSMIGAGIHDGDIVFVKKQDAVDNGQLAVVMIEDEATLKRVYYYPEQSKLILQSENPKYPPFVYMGAELEQIRIMGRAVRYQAEIK